MPLVICLEVHPDSKGCDTYNKSEQTRSPHIAYIFTEETSPTAWLSGRGSKVCLLRVLRAHRSKPVTKTLSEKLPRQAGERDGG